MKKLLVAAAALTLGSAVCMRVDAEGTKVSEAGKIVSIDSLMILQKSREGQELSSKIQKEIESFQTEIKKVQKELADAQESLGKQAKLLSKEALEQKSEELNGKRKNYERIFADKEEALRSSIQKQQLALRDRQLQIINGVSEKEGYAATIDKNAPGLLFVSSAIDKTDYMLKAVDDRFSANTKAATIAKAPAASVAKVKTV